MGLPFAGECKCCGIEGRESTEYGVSHAPQRRRAIALFIVGERKLPLTEGNGEVSSNAGMTKSREPMQVCG